MPRPSRFQSKTVQFLYDRYIGDDPERVASFEQSAANAEIAQAIYDLRTQAGLTQAQLAKRVGTTRTVISRLEDTDYDGHSLSMLRRVASALDCSVEIKITRLEPRSAKVKVTGKSNATKAQSAKGTSRRATASKSTS